MAKKRRFEEEHPSDRTDYAKHLRTKHEGEMTDEDEPAVEDGLIVVDHRVPRRDVAGKGAEASPLSGAAKTFPRQGIHGPTEGSAHGYPEGTNPDADKPKVRAPAHLGHKHEKRRGDN